MQFTKMEGAGNDYIYLNGFESPGVDDIPSLARAMSDRHFGVGGDGLVLITPSEQADARMIMHNADGSRAEMCGNAIRCVAKFVRDRNLASHDELAIETDHGVLTLQCFSSNGAVDRVRVNMSQPILTSADIPTTLPGDPPINARLEVAGRSFDVTCVSTGNPHCVTFVEEPTDELVLGIGPQIEMHAAFPSRVNVEFIQVLSATETVMRVWERGSGETWACGTGACGAVVAGVLAGKHGRQVTVHLRGGDLEIEWREDSNEIFMTGPAREVFTGEWPHATPATDG
jgi:diaminopimelate epimerase